MYMEAGLVKEAHSLFSAGEFKQAKSLYQQLSDMLGKGLFDFNIRLCDNKLAGSELTMPVTSTKSVTDLANVQSDIPLKQLEQQLNITQQQLEYYYQRCQELSLRLMDV